MRGWDSASCLSLPAFWFGDFFGEPPRDRTGWKPCPTTQSHFASDFGLIQALPWQSFLATRQREGPQKDHKLFILELVWVVLCSVVTKNKFVPLEPNQTGRFLVRWTILFIMLLMVTAFSSIIIPKISDRQSNRNERPQIINSYHRLAEKGHFPKPMDMNSIQLLRFESGAPFCWVRVRTDSGETNYFSIIKPSDGSKTNWSFRPR